MVPFRVAALTVASVFLMLPATEASACSCARDSAEQQFAKADLVVKGRMKTVTYGIDIPGPDSGETYRMTRGEFEIERVLKGVFEEKAISIYTGAGSGDCGRLGDFLNAAYYYHDEKSGVIELGLRKGELAGQVFYSTSICEYAKFPKDNEP